MTERVSRLAVFLGVVALLLAGPAGGDTVDLSGGKRLSLVDREGTRSDMAMARFVKDPNITEPLPDPTADSSWVRIRSEDRDTGYLGLEQGLWESVGTNGYKYRDTRAMPGAVAKVLLKTKNGQGKLVVILRYDVYGAVALQGPEDYVEVRLKIGETIYCGRFDAAVSEEKRNESGKVKMKGPSMPCGPSNIIVMIGDGMGPEQVKAGGIYENGSEGSLGFEALPYTATATTFSASSSITDSAAAATAIATGEKVNNGVISIATPGGESELTTVLENATARGLAVGLVTTTYMTHATPAAFGAHESSRYNYAEIAADYLNQTKPNVILGGGANGMAVADAQSAGYTVVIDRAELQAVDTSAVSMLSGQFGSAHLPYELDGLGSLPHLSEMVTVALDILDNDPDGFFLMIEGGRIDHACHSNDIDRAVEEVVEFDNAFDVVWSWASARDDTLVIVTADHETGGLTVTGNNGVGVAPTVTWSTTEHTATDVGVYAWGRGAMRVAGVLDNTDLHDIAW